MSEQTDGLAALRDPFKPEQINQIPKGGVVLDYVGHAHITERLLEVDPLWNWAPVSLEDDGRPRFDRDEQGNPVGLWINLTICGLTRAGYGSVIPGKGDAIKELIGDAIRNAAMRFGCGLELWMKERVSDNAPTNNKEPATKPQGATPARVATPSLPPAVTCTSCGAEHSPADIRATPSKFEGKPMRYNCPGCKQWVDVVAARPKQTVPAKDETDDLPF